MFNKKWNWPKYILFLKNPQFICNNYETWLKLAIHKYHILSKFRNDRMKIVDFSIKAYFWVSSIFYWTLSISGQKSANDKKPHFSSNQADIQANVSTQELVIFTKFYKDWDKIVNFLLIAYFWASNIFCISLNMLYFISNKRFKIVVFFGKQIIVDFIKNQILRSYLSTKHAFETTL